MKNIEMTPAEFEKWAEAHYEIASILNQCVVIEHRIIFPIYQNQGHEGLYALAMRLTWEWHEEYREKDLKDSFFHIITDWTDDRIDNLMSMTGPGGE